MKNMKKLVALFAAAVMTMSLSVSAFAAEVTSKGTVADENFTLVFEAAEGDAAIDQLTMIAYLVPAETVKTVADIPAYSSQTIVAIDQVGGDDGFGEVPVDVEKLIAGNAIAVVMGNSNGTVEKALITYSAQDNAVYVTFMNGTEVVGKIAIVDGKAVLPTTVPTLAAPAGYATTAYTFVGWVTEGDVAVTDATEISANTTVYAKFKSNLTTGDISGDGEVKLADRGKINAFIKSKGVTNADSVQVKISHLLPDTVVTGDISGDGEVKLADRGKINAFIKSKGVTNADSVQVDIYVVNK